MRRSPGVYAANRAACAGLVLLGFVSTASPATQARGDSAAARWYKSPSGVYALFVKPHLSHRGATYRFEKNGYLRWSDPCRPYALREVTVTDEGLVVGYAYRSGVRAVKKREPMADGKMRRVSGPVNPPQYLHIVILAPNGDEILNEEIERVHPNYRSTPPPPLSPFIGQFLVDSHNDRVIFRVLTLKGEAWWMYRLSTGESLEKPNFSAALENTKSDYFTVDLIPVPGTALLLVHWSSEERQHAVRGVSGRFTLLDPEFNPIWSFEAQDDYAGLAYHDAVYVYTADIRDYFKKNPAIAASDEPGRFTIRLFSKKEKISFGVTGTKETGYKVNELERVPASNSP